MEGVAITKTNNQMSGNIIILITKTVWEKAQINSKGEEGDEVGALIILSAQGSYEILDSKGKILSKNLSLNNDSIVIFEWIHFNDTKQIKTRDFFF